MNDDQLIRYSRHILLDEIGVEGQAALLGAHALVIGAGGLGSPALLYLGSAGVGQITVVDPDHVDATNLQRQIIHRLDRVGAPKAESAARSIREINPEVQVHAMVQRADAALLHRLVPQADVVLDCSDNFSTRHAVNAACVAHRKPLVSGAAIRFDGQIGSYDPRDPGSPCYACLFPPEQRVDEVACAVMGVFAPLVGLIGSMQASEALRLITGVGRSLAGRLQMIDGRTMDWTEIRVMRNPACPVCGNTHAGVPDGQGVQ